MTENTFVIPAAEAGAVTEVDRAIGDVLIGIAATQGEIDKLIAQGKELAAQDNLYAEIAAGIQVRCDEEVAVAQAHIDDGKAREKAALAIIEPVKKAAHNLHRSTTALEKVVKGFTESRLLIEQKIRVYKEELLRKARAEAEALAEQNRKEAERAATAAQKRLDKIAEGAGGIEAEIARIEAELAEAELTDVEYQVYEARLNALKLQLAGKQERIEDQQQKVEAASFASAAFVAPAATVNGKAIKTRWRATAVADPKALMRAILDGKAPDGLIKAWDMTKITQLANMGQKLPGVAYAEEVR